MPHRPERRFGTGADTELREQIADVGFDGPHTDQECLGDVLVGLALRQVRTPVARKLVEILQQPIIATSANISGQPTCSSGIEVFGTMDGRVRLVLDGGGCVGTGSTTVDITEPYWRVIKEGAITEKQIADVLHVA